MERSNNRLTQVCKQLFLAKANEKSATGDAFRKLLEGGKSFIVEFRNVANVPVKMCVSIKRFFNEKTNVLTPKSPATPQNNTKIAVDRPQQNAGLDRVFVNGPNFEPLYVVPQGQVNADGHFLQKQEVIGLRKQNPAIPQNNAKIAVDRPQQNAGLDRVFVNGPNFEPLHVSPQKQVNGGGYPLHGQGAIGLRKQNLVIPQNKPKVAADSPPLYIKGERISIPINYVAAPNKISRPIEDKNGNNFVNDFRGCRNLGLKPEIERKFRSVWQQCAGQIQKMTPNAYGFKKIPCGNTAFFINKDNKVLYRGTPVKGAAGAYKRHQYGNLADGQIGLVPIPGGDGHNDFSIEAKTNNEDITRLNLDTVILNTVVEDHLMIAPYGGENVLPIIRSAKIPLRAFDKTVRDLATLHKNNIYLLDIKPGNMTLDMEKGQVNFIDVDGRVRIEGNKRYNKELPPTTYHYTTNGLRNGFLSQDVREQAIYLRTADEYAFLLSMIDMTADSRNIWNMHDAAYKAAVKIHGVFPEPGLINARNEGPFVAWINQNIVPEFRRDAIALLRNPAEFARTRSHHVYLNDMIIR